MPTATLPTLTPEQTDDLLYLARLGSTPDLTSTIDHLAKTLSTTPSTILSSAIDPDTGNSLLHMASANGHTESLQTLLKLLQPHPTSTPSTSILNHQNASGNTTLHWAALNGHLEAVKVLVGAGADVTVVNGAGQDAVYAAEVCEKVEVAGWLLKEGSGLEVGGAGGRAGVHSEEEDDGREAEGESNGKGLEGEGLEGNGSRGERHLDDLMQEGQDP